MKIILAGALTVAALTAFHIPALKKRRGIILALYAMGMILFFAVYNIRTIGNIITFYHPKNQTVYQSEFADSKEYPDAFLDEFFKGKTVYTPDDAFSDVDYKCLKGGWDYDFKGNYWLFHYYHAVNMWNYLEFNGSTVVREHSFNVITLSDDQKAYFEDLGPANDMMRYTFLLTPYTEEWGNGFYYYWFYNTFIGDSRVYICTEDLMEENEIVVLWQHEDLHDTESYYIASKRFFDGVIAK